MRCVIYAAMALSLTGCDAVGLAQDFQARTAGDANARAEPMHMHRREWDQVAQDTRKGFMDACRAQGIAKMAEGDYQTAGDIYSACLTWHGDNKPPLLVTELAIELKALYQQLTDKEIKALGLPLLD